MSEYATISGRSIAEIEEKKSRFIAHLAHVESEEEALSFLEEIRTEHRMARHNVYAYILRGEGASERIRYSDDGEPQKTAGLPTLQTLQHAGLTDIACVVTRYFGGTLLGTGGLVRAYTQATQSAIAESKRVTVSVCVDITLRIAYPLHDQMVRIAAECNAQNARYPICRYGNFDPAHARRNPGVIFDESHRTVPWQEDINISKPLNAIF